MKLSNQVISAQNVQNLGEQIAIIAVKTKSRRLSGKLDRLIKGLLFDVYKRNTPGHIFSDGYDLVQTAVCFLWEYRGRRLDEPYGKDGKGKNCNILYACYHVVDRCLTKYCKKIYTTVSLEEKIKQVEEIPCRSVENDYTKYDRIVEKMHLKQGEQETLDCYMAGMTYFDIAKFLGVNSSTIWRRRMSLQKKYLQAIY